MATNQSRYTGRRSLSVNSEYRIDSEFEYAQNQPKTTPRIVFVAKWMLTFVLCAALILCLGGSKVTVLGLCSRLNVTVARATDKEDRIEAGRIYLQIGLILLVPDLLNLLRALWVCGCRGDMPWPRRRAVMFGILSAVLESVGLSLLVLTVFPYCNGIISLLIANTVFFIPSLDNVVRGFRDRHQRKGKPTLAKFILATVFEAVGLSLVMYLSWEQMKGCERNSFWHVPVAILCVSVAWSPTLLKEMVDSSLQYPGQEWSTKRTYRMAIISNVVKVLITPFFSFILFYFYHIKIAMEEFTSAWNWPADETSTYFAISLSATVLGYSLAFFAYHTRIQKFAFFAPVFISTILYLSLMLVDKTCHFLLSVGIDACYASYGSLSMVLPAAASLYLGQLLSVGWIVLGSDTIILQKEAQVFWMPSFNGVALRQWLLLNRRNYQTDRQQATYRNRAKRSTVFICTTMYREGEEEMRQLLDSINSLNYAKNRGTHMFYCHIIFDKGIKWKNVTRIPCQLFGLLEPTLGIRVSRAKKTLTPYGMKLSWNLPGNEPVMEFHIHLKDELKVKTKKRWSQIMYMSYVLDYMDHKNNENYYILATDGDVKFSPDAVQALLDLMICDSDVGAVCARTHPLGSGPLVWYQTFEYALGHWFQKATEHVLGCVLCAPGCFSVYRCKAIKQVIPKYSSNVEEAHEFLMKDMGEDRWLCTLLIQNGWRIKYCAASHNSTFCPQSFREFFKQRRRWIGSTIINLAVLIKEWKIISHFNSHVSFLFLVYQIILLLFALICPGTVILVVSGGLLFAVEFNPVVTACLQGLVCVIYFLVCLKTSEHFQMKVAMLLSAIYAIVMLVSLVGAAVQMVDDAGTSGETIPGLPMSFTTLFLTCLAGIVIIGGILHPTEVGCLFYGLAYLLYFPMGFLLMTIYTTCNITDRSWGTRAERETTEGEDCSWPTIMCIKELFWRCFGSRDSAEHTTSSHNVGVQTADTGEGGGFREETERDSLTSSCLFDTRTIYSRQDSDRDFGTVQAVEDWLDNFSDEYSYLFRSHGFEDTTFLAGLTEMELRLIGVNRGTHIRVLMDRIRLLPVMEIERKIPEDVNSWLDMIDLSMYRDNFRRNGIMTSRDLALLKGDAHLQETIVKTLEITKMGHVKRLLYAVGRLHYPSRAEKKVTEMKREVETLETSTLEEDEYNFWEQLVQGNLEPEQREFGNEDELQDKLRRLRNTGVTIVILINLLWIVLVMSLAMHSDLNLLGSNFAGLVYIFLFGLIFLTQFICMLFHRFSTMTHYLALTPFWTFTDFQEETSRKTIDEETPLLQGDCV